MKCLHIPGLINQHIVPEKGKHLTKLRRFIFEKQNLEQ